MATDTVNERGDERHIEMLKRSLRVHRGKLSRAITSGKRLAANGIDESAIEDLKESKAEIKRCYNQMEEVTMELQNLDPEQLDDYNDELDVDRARFEEARELVMKAIATANGAANNESRNREVSNGRVNRINEALKPEILAKDATPVEMRHWVEAFQAYYMSNRMDTLTIQEKQS
ncbi:Hypothetical predicted protein, partial [Paramuricea clavata]